MAAIGTKEMKMYHIAKYSEDYKDVVATGRCRINCCDIDGSTLAVANIYGWTGGLPWTIEAERTDDIIAIVRKQFAEMASGPEAIVGDLNGPVDVFPTLLAMIKEEGWTDIGDPATICNGRPAQNT